MSKMVSAQQVWSTLIAFQHYISYMIIRWHIN